MKRYVRSTLSRFTCTDQPERLKEARSTATSEILAGAVRQSRHFEEEYWRSDNIHETVEPVIIDLASDDKDGDDELFLESEDESVL